MTQFGSHNSRTHKARLDALAVRMRRQLQIQAQSINFQELATAGAKPQDALHRLEQLTATEHAVLLAAMEGVPVERVAALLDLDDESVLHRLANAADRLGAPSVEAAVHRWRPIVSALDDSAYEVVFGIQKRWWTRE